MFSNEFIFVVVSIRDGGGGNDDESYPSCPLKRRISQQHIITKDRLHNNTRNKTVHNGTQQLLIYLLPLYKINNYCHSSFSLGYLYGVD